MQRNKILLGYDCQKYNINIFIAVTEGSERERDR